MRKRVLRFRTLLFQKHDLVLLLQVVKKEYHPLQRLRLDGRLKVCLTQNEKVFL
ncbi:hypothetical protein H7097_03375 [Aeromicrobium sp.]|nr:hypothetical protein [Candidatus Saccharibacteria bacterium]